jgi:hypothetical protein
LIEKKLAEKEKLEENSSELSPEEIDQVKQNIVTPGLKIIELQKNFLVFQIPNFF